MSGEADLDAARRGELRYYTTREAAAYLRLTVPALIKNLNKGILVPIVRGGPGMPRRNHLFDLEGMDAFIGRQAERAKTLG